MRPRSTRQLLRAHRRKGPHRPDPRDPECVAFARDIWARYKWKAERPRAPR